MLEDGEDPELCESGGLQRGGPLLVGQVADADPPGRVEFGPVVAVQGGLEEFTGEEEAGTAAAAHGEGQPPAG